MKIIKLMADYESTGLCDSYGILIEYEDLSISEEMIQYLKSWCSIYDTCNKDYLDENNFDYKSFNNFGKIIFEKLKKELPEYYIVFVEEKE